MPSAKRKKPDHRPANSEQKLVALMDVLSASRGYAALVATIDRMPSRQEFFRSYLATNTPFLAKGVLAEIPACTKWIPKHLIETYEDVQIECQNFPRAALTYTTNPRQYRQSIGFHRFLRALGNNRSSKRYVTCQNRLLAVPELQGLWNDFSAHIPMMNLSRHLPADACLWLGPAGTLTPLHHDLSNIMFAQIWGRKEIVMIPPTELPKLGNRYGVYSGLPLRHRTLTRRLARDRIRFEVHTVEAGDLLFLPVAWWHSVLSLTPSISLSCHKFRMPSRQQDMLWRERFWASESTATPQRAPQARSG